MVLRNDCPGVPNYYTGERVIDPLPVTKYNIDEHLVGWMTPQQLAYTLHIHTVQGIEFVRTVLVDNNYAQRDGAFSKFVTP